MAVFAYQGTGDGGERRTGEVEASSRSEALRRLAMDRIQPLTLVAKAEMAAPAPKAKNQAAGKSRRDVLRMGGAAGVAAATSFPLDLLGSKPM